MPVQDFDIYHAGSPGPPQGWDIATTGSSTVTYNQDVQTGSVNLATGTTSDSKLVVYLDNDIIIPGSEAIVNRRVDR